MTHDYRALCAELVQALDDHCLPESQGRYFTTEFCDAFDRARAALAQPEPERPTRLQLMRLADDMGIASLGDAAEYARAVLARYGSAPRPIPVAERLPGAEDCDAEGRCWFSPWYQQGYAPSWRLIEPYLRHFSDAWWLPAHALPIPT